MEENLIPRLMSLFAGLERVYGCYILDGTNRADGKREGRGAFKRNPVWPELWQKHLAGEQSLGVVPIRDDATCVFGCIDIDTYQDFDVATVAQQVADLNLPLLPCRSKSGGCHAYIFCAEPVPAETMRARLSEMAAALGRAGAEIFPVQSHLVSTDDCGSFINLPYFDGGKDGRYAICADGSMLTVEEFLDVAEGLRQPLTWFNTPIVVQGAALFSDGPPCLEKLVQINGFGQGQRNNLMYDVAVYAMKARADDWMSLAQEINEKAFKPPMNPDEVDGVVKSVARRRGYRFRCKTEPLKSYCDTHLCRLRPYGIGREGSDGGEHKDGAGESFPRLGQLRKLLVEPPVWFWDTTGGRTIELTTEELQSPRLFQKRCMEVLNQMPSVPALADWAKFVMPALANAIEIDAPEDSSDEGQVWELLEHFCTGRVQAKSKEEITHGKPWTEDGVTWFKLADFRQYLAQKQFKSDATRVHRLSALFYKQGLQKTFFNIKGKGINVWGVKAFGLAPPPQDASKDQTTF